MEEAQFGSVKFVCSEFCQQLSFTYVGLRIYYLAWQGQSQPNIRENVQPLSYRAKVLLVLSEHG